MTEEPAWRPLAERLKALMEDPEKKLPEVNALCELLEPEGPQNVALILEELEPEQAAWIFQVLKHKTARAVLPLLGPEHAKAISATIAADELAEFVGSMSPREAADVLAATPVKKRREAMSDGMADEGTTEEVEKRLKFKKGTVGRMMTNQFLRVPVGITVERAIELVRRTDPHLDIPGNLYVVERDRSTTPHRDRIKGAISIRTLMMHEPHERVEDVMSKDVVCVRATADQRDAAALMAKYKFTALPVVDGEGDLIGVVPSEDLIPVIVGRLRHLYVKTIGTDAERMEKLSPWGEAKLRVPWLLGTMAIELGAGVVISHYDEVLQKVILLASFMPVISAISGNVGLQAAAITVRALDTGTRTNLWKSIRKEAASSLLMALICGGILAVVGGIWSRHIPFGLVIGAALICSMLTAGFMGTIIPAVSKRFGFDPATTAGPFETAFQDVIGFGVFLWLATMLQDWIS